MKNLIKLTFLLLFTSAAYGQAPEKFKYQAVVRNEAGEIVSDQVIGVKLDIHQSTEDGTVVYGETFTVTTNSYGLIYLNIGEGDVTEGSFSSVDWENGPFYINTSIDFDGGVAFSSLGTSELLSVPYALFSNKSVSSTFADSASYSITSKKSDTANYALNIERDNYYFQATSGWVGQEISGDNYTEFANFNTEVIDPSDSFNHETSTFIAPTNGVYQLNTFLTVASASPSGGGVFFGFIVNDATYPDPGTVPTTVLSPGNIEVESVVPVFGILELNEGDEVKVGIIGAADGEHFYVTYSAFSGYKIR